MGYYARARNLHAAARIIIKDWGGKIPSAKEDLRGLPGFGPYTAGAVASIAFNQRAPALDGNVKRVLSRLSGISDSVSPLSQKRLLENFGEDLIPEGSASEFNQALMDLGAMVCLPARPKCSSCPVRKSCSFPASEKKTPKPQERYRRKEVWAVALLENKGRFLIHRKDGRGLLVGLWQFPTVVIPPGQKEERQKEVLRAGLRKLFGIKTQFQKSLPPLQHSFTHIQATLRPYFLSLSPAQHAPQTALGPSARWIKLTDLDRYPVSRAMMKVADLLKSGVNGV
jgi:A/G-specific adenine glycosylase